MFILAACGQQIASISSGKVSINIASRKQEQSAWCWAACSQAILEYYGKEYSQCEIVNWVLEQRGIQADACENPDQNNISNVENNTPGSLQDILSINGIDTTITDNNLSMAEIKNQIDHGKPFIIYLYDSNNGFQHYIVGVGYDISQIYFMEPYYGEIHQVSPNALNSMWKSTIIIN